MGTPRAVRGCSFLLGVERWARGTPGDARTPAQPRLLHGMQPHGLHAHTNPPHWQGGDKEGDLGMVQAKELGIQSMLQIHA